MVQIKTHWYEWPADSTEAVRERVEGLDLLAVHDHAQHPREVPLLPPVSLSLSGE